MARQHGSQPSPYVQPRARLCPPSSPPTTSDRIESVIEPPRTHQRCICVRATKAMDVRVAGQRWVVARHSTAAGASWTSTSETRSAALTDSVLHGRYTHARTCTPSSRGADAGFVIRFIRASLASVLRAEGVGSSMPAALIAPVGRPLPRPSMRLFSRAQMPHPLLD
ncbi:uncharacterized protein PSFLO_04554 [Pseudozyma flocculosa]|uniref:Uncharacterized protein n=1 Tax=Pseudozyma flocculosa TaxID=84751 RepID=A0A5C3F568_9BASI|nr:uncharacterized protein PSFLO_04554 [Pseudozyma flocculosa]